jgi:hypothetical protein
VPGHLKAPAMPKGMDRLMTLSGGIVLSDLRGMG